MKEFIELLLTKLGLGVDAHASNLISIEDRMHRLLGEDFHTGIVGNTIQVVCNSKLINIRYEITDNRVTAIAVS